MVFHSDSSAWAGSPPHLRLTNMWPRPLTWRGGANSTSPTQAHWIKKLSNHFYVLLMMAIISCKWNWLSVAAKKSGRRQRGEATPRARRGWLKNKLISGPIDGGQAGKYHGKLNEQRPGEQRHWPALINSMELFHLNLRRPVPRLRSPRNLAGSSDLTNYTRWEN